MFLALGVLALGMFFGPHLLAGESLALTVLSDPGPVFEFYPWDVFSAREFSAGYFPLWNPYNALGVPHLANYQTAVFHPLKAPFFVWPVLPLATALFLVRYLLAFWWMGWALREHNFSLAPSIIGALTFAFSGYFIRYGAMVHTNGEIFLPLAMLITHRFLVAPRFKTWAGVTLVTVMIMLGGNAETTVLLCGFIVVYAVAFVRVERRGEGMDSARFRSAAAVALACIAAGVIAFAQLSPFAEAVGQSWHIHAPGLGRYHYHPWSWFALGAPWLFGEFQDTGFFHFLAPSIGVTGVMLVVLAIVPARRPQSFAVRFSAIGTVAGLCLVLGVPGFALLGEMPVLERVSIWKYGFPAVLWCMTILIAEGAERIVEGNLRRPHVGTAIAIALALIALSAAFARTLAGGGEHSAVLDSGHVFVYAVLGVTTAAIIVHATRVTSPTKRVAVLLIVVLVSLVVDANGFPRRENKSILAFSAHPVAPELVTATQRGERVVPVGSFLHPNLNLLGPVADVRLYDALYPKRYISLLQELLDFSDDDSIWYFFSHGSYFPIPATVADNPVLREMSAGPYVTKRAESFPDATRYGTVWIHRGTPHPRYELRTGEDSAALDRGRVTRASQHLRISVTGLDVDALVIRDGYYPGWRAWVDGAETRIHPYQEATQEINLGAEAHELLVRYIPYGFRIGLWTTLASLIALAAILLHYARGPDLEAARKSL